MLKFLKKICCFIVHHLSKIYRNITAQDFPTRIICQNKLEIQHFKYYIYMYIGHYIYDLIFTSINFNFITE